MHNGDFSAQLLHQYGYVGLAIGLAINCMGFPISAEMLLPLTGALSKSGGLNLVIVFFVAVFSQVAGFTVSYFMARHGGFKLLEKYGHLAFINHSQLRKLHKLFKRHGTKIVFAGFYLPGVHGYMGYVAGLGKLHFPMFLLLNITSTIIWTSAFLGLGMMLTNHLDIIWTTMNNMGIILVFTGLLVGLGLWYSKHYAR